MLASVTTAAILGLEGRLVEVQVDLARAPLPIFTIVGLPDGAVREARERVRAAVRNSGFDFPSPCRITVNLAPAQMPKRGPAYDLPLALALLVATGYVQPPASDSLVLGELSLAGQVRHTLGILPMVAVARAAGLRQVYVPAEDAAEAALVEGVEVLPVASLGALAAHLSGEAPLQPVAPTPPQNGQVNPEVGVDLADVRGQEHAKRALEVAAAGGHNLLRYGSECLYPLPGGVGSGRSRQALRRRAQHNPADQGGGAHPRAGAGLTPPASAGVRLLPVGAAHFESASAVARVLRAAKGKAVPPGGFRRRARRWRPFLRS